MSEITATIQARAANNPDAIEFTFVGTWHPASVWETFAQSSPGMALHRRDSPALSDAFLGDVNRCMNSGWEFQQSTVE